MIKSKEDKYVKEASNTFKDVFAKKGIIIRTEDLKEPLLNIGKLYHQMETEDEI